MCLFIKRSFPASHNVQSETGTPAGEAGEGLTGLQQVLQGGSTANRIVRQYSSMPVCKNVHSGPVKEHKVPGARARTRDELEGSSLREAGARESDVQYSRPSAPYLHTV